MTKNFLTVIATVLIILGAPSLSYAAECPSDTTNYTTPTADSGVNETARVTHALRELCLWQEDHLERADTLPALEAIRAEVADLREDLSESPPAAASPVTREDVWSLTGLIIGLGVCVVFATVIGGVWHRGN